MANSEHLEIVRGGVAAIAAWRAAHDERLDLRWANLRKVDLSGADLYEADLRGADLYGANLYGANLFGADLREANLFGADLFEANLYGANLSVADLREAYLCEANLREANLYGANLCEAHLRGADLSRAGAIWSCGPGGSRYDMCYIVQHDHGLMVNCGCFWGTLAEFEAAVEETHGDNEHGRYYRAVIEAAKAWQS